jgi:hypothetical protein
MSRSLSAERQETIAKVKEHKKIRLKRKKLMAKRKKADKAAQA